MRWIYLSPHLDDAAFSCGGLIWQQAAAGDAVEICTVFSEGLPAEFPAPCCDSWPGVDFDTMKRRQEEDAASCRLLGAAPRHLGLRDACCRRSEGTGSWLYPSLHAVTGRLAPADLPTADSVLALLMRLPEGSSVVSPLALGNHVVTS